MEQIWYRDELLALIVPAAAVGAPGIQFLTPDHLSQQLGYMNYPAGHRIVPHLHKPVERVLTDTMETILVKSGVVLLDLFISEDKRVATRRLAAGDWVVLGGGGHGFRVVEAAELFEVKQGPYLGVDADKTKFIPEDYRDA